MHCRSFRIPSHYTTPHRFAESTAMGSTTPLTNLQSVWAPQGGGIFRNYSGRRGSNSVSIQAYGVYYWPGAAYA
jgi:hypothetical protein